MTSPEGAPVFFEFDQSDRMRLCLRRSGVGVSEIAEYLGVTRTTVGNWINGHTSPSGPVLKLWALRFGVSLDWLRDGVEPASDGPDGWAPRGSNPQPTDYKLAPSAQVIRFPELRRLAATA